MKEKEIIAKYKISISAFYAYLDRNNLKYSETFTGSLVVDDNVIDEYMAGFLKEKAEKDRLIAEQNAREAAQKAREAEEAARKKKAMEEEAARKRKAMEEEAARRRKAMEDEAARKKKAMAEMLITSGFSFDGYKIVKYSGYISGDDAISVDRGLAIFGVGTENVKDKLMESLVTIRRNALRELKEAAYNLGCNAVIGVDFDYLTLDPQTANLSGGTTYMPYIFGVTANGNAVIIEKTDD